MAPKAWSGEWGATIRINVTFEAVGFTLRMFEQCPELHVLERVCDTFRDCERWIIRSESFPREWDGWLMEMGARKLDEDTVGLSWKEIEVCPYASARAAHDAAKLLEDQCSPR